MTDKTYNELLDELDGYNTRVAAATDTYEESLETIEEAASSTASNAAVAVAASNSASASASLASEISGLDTVEDAIELAGVEDSAIDIKNSSSGKIVYYTDTAGNKHMMWRFYVFTWENVRERVDTIPDDWTGALDCFLDSSGEVQPYIDIAMYPASNDGSGNFETLPLTLGYNYISADSVLSKANAVGLEQYDVFDRQCIVWWCLMNDTQPTGNTEYGQYHDDEGQYGARKDGLIPNDRSGSGDDPSCLSATGPSEWNHNNERDGVWGITGNYWEWLGGFKTEYGEFVVAPWRHADETDWVNTGVFVDSTGEFSNTQGTGITGYKIWNTFTYIDDFVTYDLLEKLALIPITSTLALVGSAYFNANEAERFVLSGGHWNDTSYCGLAALNGGNPRSDTSSFIVGRLAS